jgi:ribosomal protein L3
VDTDENLLLVRGSVPGPSGQYIFIRRTTAALRPQADKKAK